MRNPIDKRVVRGAAGGCGLNLQQTPNKGPGYLTAAVIEFHVNTAPGEDDYRHLTLPLLSGEARVLARQLLHMADKLDLQEWG